MTDHATPDALEVAAAIGQGLHAIADAIRDSAPKPVTYNTGGYVTNEDRPADRIPFIRHPGEQFYTAAEVQAAGQPHTHRTERAEAILDDIQHMRNRWQQAAADFHSLTTPTEYNRGAGNVTRRTIEALTAIIERRFIDRHTPTED